MKAIYKIALLSSVSAVLFACGQKGDPVEPVIPQAQPETRTLSFVLPESDSEFLKSSWVAGDEIVVHGEYASDQVTVTLSASDISSDGKTATKTVEGLYPYKNDECSSTLYAAYPASAVSNLKHCFYYSAFKADNVQMMAACNEGDSFSFHNLSGAISFIVEGDFDSCMLVGRKEAAVSADLFQVKITDKEVNLKQFLQNPSTTFSFPVIADGVSVNNVFIPGGVKLPGGYMLRFIKDGEPVLGLTDKEACEVVVGEVMELGDITSSLSDLADDIDASLATSIDTDGSANSYILYDGGLFKFKAVKGNTDTPVTGGTHAEILWESCGTDEELPARSVVAGVSYDEDTGSVCFRLPSPVKPGNALIAVADDNDVILWSWHIWVPATRIADVTEPAFAAKQLVMDRNLGALVATPASGQAPGESFGLLYQWGRKDPFPASGFVADGEITIAQGPATIDEATGTPNVFYYNPKGDWQTGGDPATLWQEGSKTMYDPCPQGYQLPTRDKGCAMWSGTTLSGNEVFTLDEANGWFTVGSLAFPLGGMKADTDGTTQAGTILWTGRWDSGTVNGYGFNSNEYRNRGNVRSSGGSVRCVSLI